MRLRVEPEDFVVDEIPLYEPAGEGEHTFVRVRKRLLNTEEVAKALARAAGVNPRDVGYAGRKDRKAVTSQWFSVPGLDPRAALALKVSGVEILEATPHPHKLRTGQLRGNRFAIRIREVAPEERERTAAALEEMRKVGLPNRFGRQRFGRDGDNANQALAILQGASRLRDRRHVRFLLSALQSAVFNDVLADRRGREGASIDRLELGDIAWIHASRGQFLVEDLEREAPRAAAFEISPTGPIFGTKMVPPGGAVAEREEGVLEAWGVDARELKLPPGIRLRGTRRPLRVCPEGARAEFTGDGLWLHFTLPAGSYATVLVEELAAHVGGRILDS